MTLADQVARFEATLSELFAGTIVRTASGLEVTLRHGPDTPYVLTESELSEIQAAFASKQVSEDTILYDSTTIEIPVAIEGYGIPLRVREAIRKEDSDNSLTYTLGFPTKHYQVFFLNAMSQKSASSREARHLVRRRLSRNSGTMRTRETASTLFEHLSSRLPYLRTLQISTVSSRTLDSLLACVSGFIFQVSYNTSTPLIEIRFLEQFLRSAHLESIRRSSVEEMEPPRRTYIPDLVYHYQMGLASDSPPLQFLSYYHVAEHFFEAVYTDDMINSVVSTLTGPSFSYRRRHDIMALIKSIRQKVRTVSERDVYNEEESLRLVIKQYVNLPRLKAALIALDASLPDYYRTTQVGFAEAAICDFNEGDHEKLAKRIAARVYKTRNAIVHSKDGGKGKYVPFHHDRELLREVPLLRFIAEEVIINSSKAM